MLEANAESSTAPTTRRTARLVFVTTAIVFYVVDVTSKVAAMERLSDGRRRDLLGDLLGLHLTRNPGAAFGTGTSYTIVLSCVAVMAAAVVVWISRRLLDRTWSVALGLLLAGVLGNLTDRLVRDPGPLRGHVVDFIQLPHWPIFNIADICINAAAVLIVVQAFRGVRLDGTREAHDTKDAA